MCVSVGDNQRKHDVEMVTERTGADTATKAQFDVYTE